MTRRNTTFLAALVLVPLMAAGPLAATRASAQDAIMLETIGAVRMAAPDEVKRMNDAATRQQQPSLAQPATAPQQHAAVID